MNLLYVTPAELFAWVGAESDPGLKKQKRRFLEARTAMGPGPVEDQLLRLMVWVGAKLYTGATHTKIVETLDILEDGNAWCDQQTKVFGFFAWHLLGVHAREMAVRHSDGHNGHAIVEAEYSDGWHVFDVHGEHQAVYRHPDDGHLMSWAELSERPDVVAAEDHWWRGSNGVGKEGFYTPALPPTTYENFDYYTFNQLPEGLREGPR